MTSIHEQVQASIKPALDKADALLDQYTEGLPAAAWVPLADSLSPDLQPDIAGWPA